MSKKHSRIFLQAKKPKSFKDFDSSTLLMTMTEEFFQPARIYYDVYDQVALQTFFLRLQCMDYDDQKKRRVWNYTDEAKTIRFAELSPPISKSMVGDFLPTAVFRTTQSTFCLCKKVGLPFLGPACLALLVALVCHGLPLLYF